MAVVPKFVGARIKRREDPRLITGLATYVDDLKLPRMAAAVIVRSTHAHAKINSIELSAARSHPGVILALSGVDLVDRIGPVPCAAAAERIPDHPVLARNKVRFVGEPMAVVVAETIYAARDAAEMVETDLEALDAVVDPEQALAAGAPIIHEELGTNLVRRADVSNSSVDQALREADRVIRVRLVNQRLAPVPMEPRGVVAQWNQGTKQLTLWSSTQIPHLLRTQLAEMLKLPETRLRVIAPEVGGGFGCKLNVYAEEGLAAYLAIKLRRPIKWIESRRENLAATTHGRDQIAYVEVGARKDGTILGIKATFICDMGAYLQLLTPAIPGFSGLMMTGCYRIPAISFEQTLVFTNKMATDAYRGAGRPEACYIAERAIDLVAGEFGLDPAQVRRKNFIAKDQFPYVTAGGLVYDSGDYERALDKALELVEYDKMRAEQAAERRRGRLLGIGLASYVEMCGIGPSALMPPKLKGGGWESATVRIEPDGSITVLTGISPHGQGQETSFAQMVADAFGTEIDDVNVVHGDTAVVQYGIGTFGSRGTSVGGTAVMMSVVKLQEKMRKIASFMMEVPPDQLIFTERSVALSADPTKRIPLQQIIEAAYAYRQPIPGVEPGLDATSFFEPPACTFPFGTHVAVVEVNRDTGEISFLKYVAVDDCGKMINPLLVEGQIHGGITQGIAQALYEEVRYDDAGQLLSATLMDYAVPRAEMLPRYELDSTVTPTNVNLLGVKGVGEAGTVGSTPAVVNAVLDALAPLGIRHLDMPLTPEKVWRAILSAEKVRT